VVTGIAGKAASQLATITKLVDHGTHIGADAASIAGIA
jgi:hypothetical protein